MNVCAATHTEVIEKKNVCFFYFGEKLSYGKIVVTLPALAAQLFDLMSIRWYYVKPNDRST